jgi:acetone carboxylase alpha subunit
MAGESFGARGVADGLDCGSPIWNSEGIQGDAEVWELTGPNAYLGRSFVPDHHGYGRFRGGSAWQSLWMVRNSELVNVTLSASGCMNGGVFHKGLFGGYPPAGWKCLWASGTNVKDLIARGEKLPSSIDEAERMLGDGTITAEEWYVGPDNQWSPNLRDGDLFGVLYYGGAGYGDPLERDTAAIEKDLADNLMTIDGARAAYAYRGDEAATEAERAERRQARLARSVPADEWWAGEQARARTGDVSELVQHMYARSAKLSDALVEQYKAFWQIDEFPYTETGEPAFTAPAPVGFYYPTSSSRPRPAATS